MYMYFSDWKTWKKRANREEQAKGEEQALPYDFA